MDEDKIREIAQLLLVAKNEFKIGKIAILNLDTSLLNMKTKAINDNIKTHGINKFNSDLVLLISHFSSCCLRLSTIYEVLKLKPKDFVLYKTLIDQYNKMDYLCHYLRDNIAHKEPDDWHTKRQSFIDNLTIKDIYKGTENNIENIINTNSDLKSLNDDINKYC